jgi:hypothetical protein
MRELLLTSVNSRGNQRQQISGVPDSLPDGTVSDAKFGYDLPNRPTSVFCEERVSFLLIAFCCDGSCSTAAKQMGDHPVAVFEIFQRASHIAGSYVANSTCINKSVNVVCSRILLH